MTATETDELASEVESLRARVEEMGEVGDGEEKMSIIATKGTLDMAYPPLILASTAAAFGWDVRVFHTFWGLDIIHEDKTANLRVNPVGPDFPIPNIVAVLPGMERLATWMMKRKIAANDTATVSELVETCIDTGVELQACQMTMDLMGYEDDDFPEEVTTGVGAATAFRFMSDAEIQLLV